VAVSVCKRTRMFCEYQQLSVFEQYLAEAEGLLWVDSRYMQLLDATVRSYLQSCCSPDPFRDDAIN